MTTLEYYVGVRNCPLHGFSTPVPGDNQWPCPWCEHEDRTKQRVIIATPADLGLKLTRDLRGTIQDFISE